MKRFVQSLSLMALMVGCGFVGTGRPQTSSAKAAKVRTITAGIPLQSAAFEPSISSALAFLEEAKKAVNAAGYEVQTLRITTTPCGQYLQKMSAAEAAAWGRSLDKVLGRRSAVAALGPANEMTVEATTTLLSQTENLSATIAVTTADNQLNEGAVHKAAAIIHALSLQSKEGLGNFRFAAIANRPAGIPFFPAGYHLGTTNDFAVGMEGAAWVLNAFSGAGDEITAKRRLLQVISRDLSPLVSTMAALERSSSRTFSGFDVSTAPQAEVSIGRAVEELSGHPFGGPGTLATCAAITDVLRGCRSKPAAFPA